MPSSQSGLPLQSLKVGKSPRHSSTERKLHFKLRADQIVDTQKSRKFKIHSVISAYSICKIILDNACKFYVINKRSVSVYQVSTFVIMLISACRQ